MRPWNDFTKLRPIEFAVPTLAVHDLLSTDFGMDDEWAMAARESLLHERSSKKVVDVELHLHPESLVAMGRWLRAHYPRRDAQDAPTRRLNRVGQNALNAAASWQQHAWFNGKALRGSHADVQLPAWTDGFFLAAFSGAPRRPVILVAEVVKGAIGSITRFRIEEVTWTK